MVATHMLTMQTHHMIADPSLAEHHAYHQQADEVSGAAANAITLCKLYCVCTAMCTACCTAGRQPVRPAAGGCKVTLARLHLGRGTGVAGAGVNTCEDVLPCASCGLYCSRTKPKWLALVRGFEFLLVFVEHTTA